MNLEETRLFLKKNQMLEHYFYKVMWNSGLLSKDHLAYYAKQYYFIEEAFLKCLLLMKTKYRDNKKITCIIEENIQDETGNGNSSKAHLQLWAQFCQFLDVDMESITNTKPNSNTQNLIDNYQSAAMKSLPSAIGVIYSYEQQIPDISESKIQSLAQHYGATHNGNELDFFKIHQQTDKWHTKQWESIIAEFLPSDMAKFNAAARLGVKLLQQFLDGIMNYFNLNNILVSQ
jgi:pyrroloquinoline quinone (PQQ) biosynthesis protein C